MKVTLDGIKAKIKGETYLVLPNGRTTVCQLTLENGFTVEGYSACVDPSEFNLNIGRMFAFEDAVKKIWPLEGYLLAEEMHNASLVQKALQEQEKEWTAKPVGRRIIAKRTSKKSGPKFIATRDMVSTAPWGLKKDGTPKKKPGGTRK